MSSDLIITKRRGVSWYAIWGLMVLALVIVAFILGRMESRAERLSLEALRDDLMMQSEQLEQELADMEQQKILLESSAQVDAQASEEIMNTISTLQKTIDALETELSFYRGIMAPEKDVKGLQVADFNLEATSQKQQYRFQLALTQVKKHDIFLKGNVEIQVRGTSGEKAETHDITAISNLKKDDLNFTFKYFQHITGEITIPDGFVPEQIQVTAKTRGRKPQTASKTFNWSAT